MFSRNWFYVVYMVFFVGIIYLVEWFLGSLYARYVLAFTGTIFMMGMLFGQRTEKRWTDHEDLSDQIASEQSVEGYR